MGLRLQYNCQKIDWKGVTETLKAVGMGYYSPDIHQKAFENSHSVLFAFEGETLVGFGRALSDGVYQAALYDIAVVPEQQGKGIGNLIVKGLLAKVPGCNVILYASPGKEGFYGKVGFRRLKSGMGMFLDSDKMQAKGFTD